MKKKFCKICLKITPSQDILFYLGIDKIYEHYNRHLSKDKITKLLSKIYSYLILRNQSKRTPTNSVYKHYKRFQFQVIDNIK